MDIKLREYQKSDLDVLVKLLNNAKMSQYMKQIPFPYTRADGEWWLETGQHMDGTVTRAIISITETENNNGEFVGAIGMIPVGKGWKEHQAEIGYWIGEPYWGKGLATKAVKQFCEYCFQELGYKKLFGGVLSPNKGSMRVLERCGFQLEGVLRQEVVKNGTCYHVHHYGLLPSDLPALLSADTTRNGK